MHNLVDIFVAAIFVVALFQPSKQRLIAGLCMAVPILLYSIIDAKYLTPHMSISGEFASYYIMSAFVDGLVIAALCKYSDIGKMAHRLIIISCLFFAVNVIGYLMYMFYCQPDTYNYLSIALYTATLIFLLKKDISSERSNQDNMWHGWIFSNISANNLQYKNDRKEIKP